MINKLSLLVTFFLMTIIRAFSADELGVSQALIVYDPAFYNLSDAETLKPEISGFINDLKDKHGLELTFKTYGDEDISLFYEDEPRYNHLVIFPSSKKAIAAKKGFNKHQLLNFINSKGNILAVGDIAAVLPDDIRSFLNELGIYPSPKNFKLIDHFNTVNDKVKLTNSNLVDNRVLRSLDTEYDGSAALISNNVLLFPIIKSSKTGFTSDDQESIGQDTTWTFGEQGYLAVGLQALNNARLLWIGSDSLLNDDMIKWTFQEKNVLKLQFVQHHKNDEPQYPDETLYRIKDQVIYTIGVSEYVNRTWVPYIIKHDEDQMQLSFKMLDPYHRINLKPLGPAASIEDSDVKDTFIYYANFTIPDQHGMFTFELDYKRPGLTFLVDKKVVAVRHAANDEFKRSWEITNSWLYVASAGLVVIAWFVFVVNYIYITNTNVIKKNI